MVAFLREDVLQPSQGRLFREGEPKERTAAGKMAPRPLCPVMARC